MSKVTWRKFRDLQKERDPGLPEEKLARPFLEIRQGKLKTSYRVRYRGEGLNLEQTLEGEFQNWKQAQTEAERVIALAKFGEKPKAKSLVSNAELCDELVKLREPLSDATHEQIEIFMRVHIKPFLRGECAYLEEGSTVCQHQSYLDAGKCAYASDLNPPVWANYKAHFRLHRPNGSLFNHWKYMGMLFKYAFEKGLLGRMMRLPFDEGKEDNRKEGEVVPLEQLGLFLQHANRTWRDRAIVGRSEGQRPGLIRKLRKNQVDFKTGILKVLKEDSKNRRAYEVELMPSTLEILKARLELPNVKDSPYFFPSESDHGKPMDRCLTGWHSAWIAADKAERAAGRPGLPIITTEKGHLQSLYTPHDLRHTWLTEELDRQEDKLAACYSRDLSFEEADETYLHFKASHTRSIVEVSGERARAIAALGQQNKGKQNGNSSDPVDRGGVEAARGDARSTS